MRNVVMGRREHGRWRRIAVALALTTAALTSAHPAAAQADLSGADPARTATVLGAYAQLLEGRYVELAAFDGDDNPITWHRRAARLAREERARGDDARAAVERWSKRLVLPPGAAYDAACSRRVPFAVFRLSDARGVPAEAIVRHALDFYRSRGYLVDEERGRAAGTDAVPSRNAIRWPDIGRVRDPIALWTEHPDAWCGDAGERPGVLLFANIVAHGTETREIRLLTASAEQRWLAVRTRERVTDARVEELLGALFEARQYLENPSLYDDMEQDARDPAAKLRHARRRGNAAWLERHAALVGPAYDAYLAVVARLSG